ncbi:MAG: APC family permease [Candidatus Kapabacteria bacterium]|nr:APC family permease [Candidatus Kapabacteria bacterium]
MSFYNSNGDVSFIKKFKQVLFGSPRNVNDSGLFHKIALIPLLAWVGLGSDGLSSSAYGPEEIFRSIQGHTYLALFLILAVAFTIFIISYAYTRIIEHFPHGGGGYIVATHMLGEKAGVVSGSALIVDYILTITVSITSCVDALFSNLPIHYQSYKVMTSTVLIVVLIVLNIRGVKESITVLTPIFIVFVLTHILLLGYGIFSHLGEIQPVISNANQNLTKDLSSIGFFGIFFMVIRAYSLGGGTYTGIEAVSNGLQIMREPKVKTGKRTMLYMASSLAVAAAGLLLCYLLVEVKLVPGKTLNTVLAETLFGNWRYGNIITIITIFSEGALLFVAAQTGFIDAPRVMANMAVDSWLPHRFAAFSERLTMRNGIVLIGLSALLILWYTNGSIGALVVMYSINVFLTFTLSEFGMSRFYFRRRKTDNQWKKHIVIHLIGLVLCATILLITVSEKFAEGGWITLLITGILIIVSYRIKKHYLRVRGAMVQLEDNITEIYASSQSKVSAIINRKEQTVIQLVGSYNGFGIHTLLSVIKTFPELYKNIVFVSVAVIDQGMFKGENSIEGLKESVIDSLKSYVNLAVKLGFNAEYYMAVGTEVNETAVELIDSIKKEYPNSTVFSGRLAFQKEKFYHRLLHNETAYAVQRKLQFNGITNVILPIRVN